MINLENINFSYETKIILNHISAEFEAGKIHGIVGLNGAGKTTLFNLLSCALRPDSGKITLNQKSIHRNDVTILETANYFYPRLTGQDYLDIFKQSNEKFNLDTFQKHFRLPLDRLIETYSAGMKKKLALLSVLKQEKPIYLFDEPFNGLDLESGKLLEIILEALKKNNRTLFISSHILSPLLQVCDDITLLEKGNFKRKYTKTEFNQIENSLFADLIEQAKDSIQENF